MAAKGTAAKPMAKSEVFSSVAEKTGLAKKDVAKWRKDMESREVKEKVTKDRTDGAALGLESTPTIYLNGREYTDHRDIESLRDWINEELGR